MPKKLRIENRAVLHFVYEDKRPIDILVKSNFIFLVTARYGQCFTG